MGSEEGRLHRVIAVSARYRKMRNALEAFSPVALRSHIHRTETEGGLARGKAVINIVIPSWHIIYIRYIVHPISISSMKS